VLLHRISAAWRLGDGTAIDHARKIRAGTIRLPERQARYWVDVARAFDQWGKPTEYYRALRIAERAAPEEVRAQLKVRALQPVPQRTAQLRHPTRRGLSGERCSCH
jgi:hypothetical protein